MKKAGLAISTSMHIALGLLLASPSPPVLDLDPTQTTAPLPVSLVFLADDILVPKGVVKTDNPVSDMTKTMQEKKHWDSIEQIRVDAIAQPQEKKRHAETALFLDADIPNIKYNISPRDKPEKKEEKSVEDKQTTDPRSESERRSLVKKSGKAPFSHESPQHIAKLQEEKRIKQSFKTVDDVLMIADADNAPIYRSKMHASGATREKEVIAFGDRNTDNSSGSFQQTLNNIVGNCVQRNWNLAAINGSTAYDLRVIAHFWLNRNGTFVSEPELTPDGGDNTQRAIITIQAREALKKCIPFSLPIDKYDQWHEVTINMKAFPD